MNLLDMPNWTNVVTTNQPSQAYDELAKFPLTPNPPFSTHKTKNNSKGAVA